MFVTGVTHEPENGLKRNCGEAMLIDRSTGAAGIWRQRRLSMAQIDKVADGIYRISTFIGQKQLSFNQFLIEDEHPALVHTGFHPIYEDVRNAVAEVLDPTRLESIIIPHFEAVECGGMGRFVGEARNAVLVASAQGARINLSSMGLFRPCERPLRRGRARLGRAQAATLGNPTRSSLGFYDGV